LRCHDVTTCAPLGRPVGRRKTQWRMEALVGNYPISFEGVTREFEGVWACQPL
jgi:hypothetical protein